MSPIVEKRYLRRYCYERGRRWLVVYACCWRMRRQGIQYNSVTGRFQ